MYITLHTKNGNRKRLLCIYLVSADVRVNYTLHKVLQKWNENREFFFREIDLFLYFTKISWINHFHEFFHLWFVYSAKFWHTRFRYYKRRCIQFPPFFKVSKNHRILCAPLWKIASSKMAQSKIGKKWKN